MTTDLSYNQLVSVWEKDAAGTKYGSAPWAHLMAAIGLAESSGNPDATNPNDNNGTQTSWGLWQISLGNHDAPAPDWNNPDENARLAIGKLQSQGLGAWGTYDSGAYRADLPAGQSVPSGVAQGTASGNGGSSGPYSNVKWYEPWTYGNAAGDTVTAAEQFAVHYGSIALAVGVGAVLLVLGLKRATGIHPQNPVTVVQEKAAPVAAAAAAAA